MNYKHSFHAGSFADVFKHSVLTLLLTAITIKDKGFCYIDTHAGAGIYNLKSNEAQRSLEYQQGINKLLVVNNPPAVFTSYLGIVKEYIKNHYYPGSPLFAEHFLRATDQMILNEYQPQIFQQLKNNFGNHPNIHCHQRNAYEFLPAVLPPNPRRGIILIDPPFEQTDEFSKIIKTIQLSLKRFTSGIYVIWYPIVALQHQAFIHQLSKLKLAPLLICELTLKKATNIKTGLIGCGMLLINPPWQIEIKIMEIAKYLSSLFGQESQGEYRVETLIN